jgi:hypothetical protein
MTKDFAQAIWVDAELRTRFLLAIRCGKSLAFVYQQIYTDINDLTYRYSSGKEQRRSIDSLCGLPDKLQAPDLVVPSML